MPKRWIALPTWLRIVDKRSAAGWTIFGISVALGLTTIFHGTFVDEADNLALGALLVQGEVLYQDLFSHHFPFAYYWTAALVAIFGKSIVALRLSVLLFQVGVFAIGMKLSRLVLVLGLTSLLWSILRIFYKGQMVLYSTFSAIAIAVIFALALSALLRRSDYDWRHALLAGVLGAVAMLSNPLSVYAIAVALLALAVVNLRMAILTGTIVAGCGALYAGYLFYTGTWPAFWADAIHFNVAIYGRYTDANPDRGRLFLEMAVHGLRLIDRRWLDFNPLKPFNGSYASFDTWLFTGFLFRFGMVALALLFVLQRRLAPAGLVYFFGAALLVIDEWEFRSAGFVLTALICIAMLITKDYGPLPTTKFAAGFATAARFCVTAMTVWLLFRAGTHLISIRDQLPYAAHLRPYAQAVESMQQVYACGRPGTALAYYPGDPYVYWFADFEPVAGYLVMWPWVAEVALPDVIDQLSREDALVHVNSGPIWRRYHTDEYLRLLLDFLAKEYRSIGDGWYAPPDFTTCVPPQGGS